MDHRGVSSFIDPHDRSKRNNTTIGYILCKRIKPPKLPRRLISPGVATQNIWTCESDVT